MKWPPTSFRGVTHYVCFVSLYKNIQNNFTVARQRATSSKIGNANKFQGTDIGIKNNFLI